MTRALLPYEKGKLVGICWPVFNMGGVLGYFIKMGVNWNSAQNTECNDTFVDFISLTGVGFLSALLLLSRSKIVKASCSIILPASTKRPNVFNEFLEISNIKFREEPLVFMPLFFVLNYCYTFVRTLPISGSSMFAYKNLIAQFTNLKLLLSLTLEWS